MRKILDFNKGLIKDIATFFHDGALDYIGKDVIDTGINQKRIKVITSFSSLDNDRDNHKKSNNIKKPTLKCNL